MIPLSPSQNLALIQYYYTLMALCFFLFFFFNWRSNKDHALHLLSYFFSLFNLKVTPLPMSFMSLIFLKSPGSCRMSWNLDSYLDPDKTFWGRILHRWCWFFPVCYIMRHMMSVCPIIDNVKFGDLVRWFPPDFSIVNGHFLPLKLTSILHHESWRLCKDSVS